VVHSPLSCRRRMLLDRISDNDPEIADPLMDLSFLPEFDSPVDPPSSSDFSAKRLFLSPLFSYGLGTCGFSRRLFPQFFNLLSPSVALKTYGPREYSPYPRFLTCCPSGTSELSTKSQVPSPPLVRVQPFLFAWRIRNFLLVGPPSPTYGVSWTGVPLAHSLPFFSSRKIVRLLSVAYSLFTLIRRSFLPLDRFPPVHDFRPSSYPRFS